MSPKAKPSWTTKAWDFKDRYTLGDKLQQHVATIRQIALCEPEKFCENLSLQENFVAATCCKKSNQTEFVRLVAATKFCCRDKDFYKISPVHTKRFVATMCRRDILLQLVAEPVHTKWSVAAIYMLLQLVAEPLHTKWSVAATCCCNL